MPETDTARAYARIVGQDLMTWTLARSRQRAPRYAPGTIDQHPERRRRQKHEAATHSGRVDRRDKTGITYWQDNSPY